MELTESIKAKALELGYRSCGIIPFEELIGYEEKIIQRVERFPESAPAFASRKRTHSTLSRDYPWAKAIVICLRRYGKYIIPDALKGFIGKLYLTDERHEVNFKSYRHRQIFEGYLRDLSLKIACESDHGIVPYRWVAMKAGLGTIRKNNFFYSHDGSWVTMDAWLIDREIEIRETNSHKKCPDNCSLCVKSCPTKSLAEPFMTNREACISNITTWKGRDMPNEKYRKECGGWLYGCDACQDVCPFNHNKWADAEVFPGLDWLAGNLTLENLLSADYAWLRELLAVKFWYINEAELWKWKVNALNAMLNNYSENYLPLIEHALGDTESKVKQMAAFVLQEIENNNLG
ncbi:MAG: epoxyqueuosine reductase [Planctomycetota bacterium]|jgi:epoxyqueuosine reductase|nr:epoxyqueuosine reductase [Planctomycetota bacterium]